MALTRKKKAGKEGRPLAEEVTGANLYADDLTIILEYVRGGEGSKADVLRTLVSEAIEAREGDKEVSKRGEKRVRRLHLEAISEGTKELEGKVDELLEIARRAGVNLDRITNQTGDNLGLNFEVLKLVEGIFAMVWNDLTKPNVIEKLKTAKGGGSVEGTLETMESRFEQRAVEKVERVRREVRRGAKAAS